MTMKSYAVIRAAPGFWVWYLERDADEPLYARTPVIGWRVEEYLCSDGESVFFNCPLTAEYSQPSDGYYVIEWPDGKIDVPETATLSNFTKATEYFLAQRQARLDKATSDVRPSV